MKKLWIAWEDDSSIRSRVLADELGAVYRPLTLFDDSRFFGWLRYPTAALQTIWVILRARPELVVTQNPSILLAFLAALLKPLFGFRLVIDLHTPFVRPPGLKKTVADLLHGYGLRHCDVVVVSNATYQKQVAKQTARPVFVLPDKVPTLGGRVDRSGLRSRHAILYICTFSVDEPWKEVLAASALLPEDTCIYMSGRSPLRSDQAPKNVILTGFLPKEDYQSLIKSVDAVMVLTTAEDNLVCGGYEAVAAGKPLILSDTAALKAYFRRGAVYTKNSREAIAQGVTRVLERLEDLTTEVEALRDTLKLEWQQLWRELLSELDLAPRQEHEHDRATRPATAR